MSADDIKGLMARDEVFVMTVGFKAGLDCTSSVRDRAAVSLFEAQIERQEAFIDRRIAANSLAVARRVYVASAIVFMSALVVFAATLVVGMMR